MQRTYGDAEAYQYAGIDAQWGQSDLAIHWLETAYRPKDGGLMDIKVDLFLKPIRSLEGGSISQHRCCPKLRSSITEENRASAEVIRIPTNLTNRCSSGNASSSTKWLQHLRSGTYDANTNESANTSRSRPLPRMCERSAILSVLPWNN
jgi:hypothetical protein